jgi:prepilin-type N-terminal cleavage/methylation domain-containing protein
MRQKGTSEKGFTLMEAMIVMIIISILSAIYVTRVYNSNSDAGGERIITDTVTSLKSRRSEALRLSGNDHRTDLSVQRSQPLEIDFGNLANTASLRVEGADSDGDCQDDNTGFKLTCLQEQKNGRWSWSYAYLDDAMKLPQNWIVLQSPKQMSGISMIFDGTDGRGVMATKIGFTPEGKAKAFNSRSGTWDSYPEGSTASDHPSLEDSPFWAIYFGEVGTTTTIRGRNSIKAAIAIAVHPSGLIERYRYDSETGWIGYNNR